MKTNNNQVVFVYWIFGASSTGQQYKGKNLIVTLNKSKNFIKKKDCSFTKDKMTNLDSSIGRTVSVYILDDNTMPNMLKKKCFFPYLNVGRNNMVKENKVLW